MVTAGQMLLDIVAQQGLYGLLRRSYGPQIRGGESASLLRFGNHPIHCMDDRFDMLMAMDWLNVDRFVDEVILDENSLVLYDQSAGEVPELIVASGANCVGLPLKDLAKEIPGGRINMVATGVAAQLLGLETKHADAVIQARLGKKGEEVVDVSKKLFVKGRDLEGLPALPCQLGNGTREVGKGWSLTGNEGCGLGALRAGVRFVAAYPITPASEILEWLSPRIEQLDGSLLQAEDELASINMIIGGSFGGVPALTATSGPGLSLMLEAFGLAVASETPIVVVNVMRGGPSTGIPTKSEQSDLDIALHGPHGDAPHLVLGALDIADSVMTTQWAVHLAESMQAPAIVLTDQVIGQSRILTDKPASIEFLGKRKIQAQVEGDYHRYMITADGVSPMAIPGTEGGMYTADGLEHQENARPSTSASDHQSQLDKRADKLEQFDYGDLWAETHGRGNTAILTWGSSTGAVREAQERLEAAGQSVKMIAMRLLMPAQPEKLADELAGVEQVLVVEQSHAQQFYRYLRSYYDLPEQVNVLARPGPALFTPGEIIAAMEQF